MSDSKDSPPPPPAAPAQPPVPPIPQANPSLIQTLTEGDQSGPRDDGESRPAPLLEPNPALPNLMTKGRSRADADKLAK
jgi:hypothetical protein